MNIKNIGSIVVGFVIAAIMLTSIMIPIISTTTDSQNTLLTNTGSNNFYYTVDGDDDYTLKSDPNLTRFTINGERVTMSNGTILSTDQCRVTISGHSMSLYDVNGDRTGVVNTQNYLITAQYTASTKTFVYTVYSGLTESDPVTNTYTYNIEKNIIYMNPKGDYVAISNNLDDQGNYPTYYINDLSQVAAGGAYTTGELDTAYFANGEIVSVGNSAYTGSADATTTKNNDYTDVYLATGYTVTISDGTSDESFVPFTTYVPATIKAHTENDNSLIGLLNLIPILVTVGILTGIVMWVFARRE